MLDRAMLAPEPPAAPSLAVAISTYRRPKGLHRLLAALAPQVSGRPGRTIVIINDGSHDSEYESVLAKFEDVVRYHALASNAGIAVARNEAARRSESDYIVFTDDDCVPPPFWLDWLAARLIASPDLDVIAGDVRPLMSNLGFFGGVQARHGICTSPSKTRGGLRFVTANVAIRRKFFWELGGFRLSEDFPGAGEDTELSVRVSRSDCSRCLDRNWFVEHEVGDGFLTNIRRYRRYGYANMLATRTTAALAEHDSLRRRPIRGRLATFLEQYRRQLPAARSASALWPLRWLSAFLASLVFVAYYDGVAEAGREIMSRQDNGGSP